MNCKINDYLPCGKRCLIKLFEEEEKTKSGIILSQQTEKPKYVKATICIFGEDVQDTKMAPGDLVIINRLKIDPIKLEGEDYHIIHYDDISFKIKN